MGPRPQGRDDGYLLRRDQPAVHRAARPPDLEAISPLSTIDATATTLYPGGILNTGFAVAWAEQRQQEAEPAGPNSGQAWAYKQIQSGDATCPANQALHGEAADLMAKITPTLLHPGGRRSARPGHLRQQDPGARLHGLSVGGRADRRALPGLVQHFTGTSRSGSPSPTGPTSTRSIPTPSTAGTTSSSCSSPTGPPLVNSALTAPRPPSSTSRPWDPETDPVTLPVDPIQPIPTYGSALSAFEKLPEVRVLFDNGAGAVAHREHHARRPRTRVRGVLLDASRSRAPAATWYLGPGNARRSRRRRERIDQYTSNADALPLTDLRQATPAAGGCGATPPSGSGTGSRTRRARAVSYVSAPLKTNTTVSGRVRSTSGSAPRPPTSTCRRRSARSARTATRRSSRTAGSAPASGSSRPARTTSSSSRAPLLDPIPTSRRRTPHRCRPGSSSRW